jgi:hypothetical protein
VNCGVCGFRIPASHNDHGEDACTCGGWMRWGWNA